MQTRHFGPRFDPTTDRDGLKTGLLQNQLSLVLMACSLTFACLTTARQFAQLVKNLGEQLIRNRTGLLVVIDLLKSFPKRGKMGL